MALQRVQFQKFGMPPTSTPPHTSPPRLTSACFIKESLSNVKTRLRARGYPKNLVERILSEVSFAGQSALKQKKKTHEHILPFVTTYHPGVKNLKYILMHKWSLIQSQPLLRTIFKKEWFSNECCKTKTK